jgi:hypothetical protein
MNIAPWLSLHSGMVLMVMPNSLGSELTYTDCLHASESGIYSASVEDSVTVRCALVFQLNILLANFTMNPVVEQQVVMSEAQSEAAYANVQCFGQIIF